ncbi:hypothetical protein BDV93DRAFT_519107 [Ceratobasidium sp. AG-I]|nr:hypothetical protein BDV93DRAFT_519107 [Ceratobasidium sp. AG-I]
MVNLEPGTYRIVNVASDTAITVPHHNRWDVVGWERHGDRNQRWFVQRSGEGYQFKNCQYGYYMAVVEPKWNARPFLSQYPTSWQLVQNRDDYNMYIIKCAGIDRVIELDKCGSRHNGNNLQLLSQDNWVSYKRWRFERLSDETGDEAGELRSQLGEMRQQLASKDQELAQTQSQLFEKSTLLEQSQIALRQAEAALRARDEPLQQQTEMADLRERMERMERLFPQARNPQAEHLNDVP